MAAKNDLVELFSKYVVYISQDVVYGTNVNGHCFIPISAPIS